MAVPTSYLEMPIETEQGVTYSVRNITPGVVSIVLAGVIAAWLIARSAWPVLLLSLLAFTNREDQWHFLYNGPRIRRTVRLWGICVYSREIALAADDSASSEEIPDSLLAIYRPRWYRLTLSLSGAGRTFTLLRSNDSDDVERHVGMLNKTIRDVLAKAVS